MKMKQGLLILGTLSNPYLARGLSVSVVGSIVSFNLLGFLQSVPINKSLKTYNVDFLFLINQDLAKKSGKVLFVFWQCRPEKPTRLLTLNKDTVWCSLSMKWVDGHW
jgi:hypothetical protein